MLVDALKTKAAAAMKAKGFVTMSTAPCAGWDTDGRGARREGGLSPDQIVEPLGPVAEAIKSVKSDGQATGIAMKHHKARGASTPGDDVCAAVKKMHGQTLSQYPVLSGAQPWASPGSGARGSVAIVVSHGFSGNPCSTRPLGEALAQKGFAVEVVRLPGHGTHWRDMLHTSYADWRAEVARAVDACHGAGKRVVVVGLSLGGTIICAVQAEMTSAAPSPSARRYARDGQLGSVVLVSMPMLGSGLRRTPTSSASPSTRSSASWPFRWCGRRRWRCRRGCWSAASSRRCSASGTIAIGCWMVVQAAA